MSSSHAIRVSVDIDATQAAVWERVSDHEDTPSWVEAVKRVTLAQSGTPRNGVGAIRVVSFKPALWSTIHERITRFEPPHSFDYVLFKGMPALSSHLGTVSRPPRPGPFTAELERGFRLPDGPPVQAAPAIVPSPVRRGATGRR